MLLVHWAAAVKDVACLAALWERQVRVELALSVILWPSILGFPLSVLKCAGGCGHLSWLLALSSSRMGNGHSPYRSVRPPQGRQAAGGVLQKPSGLLRREVGKFVVCTCAKRLQLCDLGETWVQIPTASGALVCLDQP